MLTIGRDKERLLLAVDWDGDGASWTTTLHNDYSTEAFAALVAEKVRGRLAVAVSRARETSYADGWADAKAKRSRRADFPGNI